MATSGSLTTNAYNGRALTFSWTRTSINTSTMESTISWTLKGSGTCTESGVEWYKAGNFSVVIDGVSAYSSSTRINLWNGTVVASGTKKLKHSSSGAKSFTVSIKAGIYTVAVNCSGSKTFDLTNIGYAPTQPSFKTPTKSVVSENGGKISITWTKASSYNDTGTYDLRVKINGGSWTSISKSISLATTSYSYAYGAGQGKTYQFAIKSINNVGSSSWAYSEIVTTNKITSPSILSINNGASFNPFNTNNESTAPLNVKVSGGGCTDGSDVKRIIRLYDGETALATSSFDSTAYDNESASVTYSANNYLNRLGRTKYAKTFKIVAWNENKNRNRSATVSKTFTVNINTDKKATPTLAGFTLSGGALGNPSTCFIEGISTLKVTSGNGALRRAPSGTTLRYSIHVTGATTVNSNVASFSGLSGGTKTITVTCTDERGLSTSITGKCVIQSYALPTIKSLNISRVDGADTSAKATYTLTYSPIYQYTSPTDAGKGNQLNSINSQEYSLNGVDWKSYTSGNTITGLSPETSYKFMLRVSDKVKSTTYRNGQGTIGSIKHPLSIRKTGIGIQCVPSSNYALDVSGNVRFNSKSLSFTQYGNTQKVIEIDQGDSTGLGVKIGAGGGTLLYSGESDNLFSMGTSEVLDLASDGQINFYTNCQDGLATSHRTYISSGGNLYCDNYINATQGVAVGDNINAGSAGNKGVGIRQDGLIELSGATPYIDFHYNNNTGNYNTRLIQQNGYFEIRGDQFRAVSGGYIGNFYASSASELVGFCDGVAGNRYAWMGRNASTDGKFSFTGEGNIKSFNFNKSIVAPNLAAGYVVVTPSAANTPTKVSINFGKTFPAIPRVVASSNSTVPGTIVTGVSANNTTTTGCDIYVSRTNTTNTAVYWIAYI